jgi:hypothetical protein
MQVVIPANRDATKSDRNVVELWAVMTRCSLGAERRGPENFPLAECRILGTSFVHE